MKKRTYKKQRGAQAPSKTNRAAKLLAANVEKLMNAESFKAALRFRNKLHNYSFTNVVLIFSQNPEASMIAGYRKWQTLGRQVKKGEKSLAIFAPLIHKDKESKETEVFGYKSAAVFDISQTEGEPIPQLPSPKILKDDSQQIQQTIQALEQFAKQRDNPVSYKPLQANGVYTLKSKTITIKNSLPPLQTLKTLIHELAHAIMHPDTNTEPSHTLELEAESCAFLVCDALGLDSSQYSFAYIAGWAEDPKELLPAAQRACKAADKILAALKPSTPEELAA